MVAYLFETLKSLADELVLIGLTELERNLAGQLFLHQIENEIERDIIRCRNSCSCLRQGGNQLNGR